MHPYLPFASLPAAVLAAWFTASHWSDSDHARYRVPNVAPIEELSDLKKANTAPEEKPDIKVSVFLPHIPPKPPAPVPTLILHSIMTGTDVRMASINGRLVKEGDQIEGYRVKHIASDGVELTRGGKPRHLPMRPLHELSRPAR